MRFPKFFLPIHLKIFDAHFIRFIKDYDNSDEAIRLSLEKYDIKNVGVRFEVLGTRQQSDVERDPNVKFGQIEVLKVFEDRIEINAAYVRLNSFSSGHGFFNSFYHMIKEKWGIRPRMPIAYRDEFIEDPVMAIRLRLLNEHGIFDIPDYIPVIHDLPFEPDDYWKTGKPSGLKIVKMKAQEQEMDEAERERRINAYEEALEEGLPDIEKVLEKFSEKDSKSMRGPNRKTIERAEVFKKIKDNHPEWSQYKVAMEARSELDDQHINADTVRNAYRVMGWEWERADRIR